MKAIWKGEIIAESNNTIVIEGNHYFPKNSIQEKYLQSSDTHSTCHWKGEASYCSIDIDGEINKDAVWYYPETTPLAKNIEGMYAFWKGVEVKE